MARFVNTAFVSGGPTTSAFALTAGNTVLHSVRWSGTASSVATVVDSVGNVYTRLGGAVIGGEVFDVWGAFNVPTGGPAVTITPTFTPSVPSFIYQRTVQYQQLGAASFVGPAHTATGTGGSVDPGAITTTDADQLIVVFGNVGTSGTNWAFGPGYTERGDDGVVGVGDLDANGAGEVIPTIVINTAVGTGKMAVAVLIDSNPALNSGVRVSQLPVEILALPNAPLRVSQLPVEVLVGGSAPLRVSQSVVEVLAAFLPPGSPARLTQDVVETVTQVPASARVSTALIETLSQAPAPPPHLTQQVVEVLSSTAPLPPSPARLTQLVIEVVAPFLPPPIPAAVTQLAGEVFTATPADARVTQLGAEVFSAIPAEARITHLAGEVFHQQPADARTTQLAAEVFNAASAGTRVTQAVVEIFLVPGPCFPADFPVDDVPAGGSCVAGILP